MTGKNICNIKWIVISSLCKELLHYNAGYRRHFLTDLFIIMELAVSIFSFPNRRRTFKNQNVECTWQFLFLSEILNETSDLLCPSSLIVSSESWYIHVDSEKGGLRWMCLCVVWARKEMVNEWLVTVLFQSFPHGRRVCVFQFLHQKTAVHWHVSLCV